MDENQDITEPTPKGITTAQWVMLGTLGALTVLAVVLAYAARNSGQPTDSTLLIPEGHEPWQESMRHFARAIDHRFMGIESKLAEYDTKLGIPQPVPPAPVDQTFHPTPVPPAPEPVSMSGVPVGAEEPAPPGPAAVSLPPDAGN